MGPAHLTVRKLKYFCINYGLQPVLLQIHIILNVLVSSFEYICCGPLANMNILLLQSRIDFRRHNLTFTDVRL